MTCAKFQKIAQKEHAAHKMWNGALRKTTKTIIHERRFKDNMNWQELAKNIQEANDGKIMIRRRELMKVLGVGDGRARRILNDLTPMFSTEAHYKNRAKLYFVDDVAKEIMRKGM